MYRRTLLSIFGAAFAATTAGCLAVFQGSGSDSGSGEAPTGAARSGGHTGRSTPDPTAGGTPSRVTTGDGYAVDYRPVDVQPSILARGVHTDVRAYHGTSFLRLPVVLRDDAGDPIGGLDRYEKLQKASSVRLDRGTHDQVVFDRAHDGPGVVLALAVPFGDYDGGEFRLGLGGGGSVHVPLPDGVLAAIADPAAFAVPDLEVEAPVEGGTLSATITVQNGGGAAGRFLAELGPTSVSDFPAVDFTVQAGEEVRQDVRVDVAIPPNSEEATIRLDWGVDQLERTVRVAGG